MKAIDRVPINFLIIKLALQAIGAGTKFRDMVNVGEVDVYDEDTASRLAPFLGCVMPLHARMPTCAHIHRKPTADLVCKSSFDGKAATAFGRSKVDDM